MESLYLLTGENGCGKDFFYKNRNNLKEFYKTSVELPPLECYTRLAFADYVKTSLGVPVGKLTCSGLPRIDIINHANTLKEIYGENIFVKIVVDQIINQKMSHVIITDLRFHNELEVMKEKFPHCKVVSIVSNPHNFPIDISVKRIEHI